MTTPTAIGRAMKAAVRATQTSSANQVTDRDLLQRFADGGDQSAFAQLVRRHTGLVLGVCRRTLANQADAEDACQAVFLLLARKAKGGRWQASIANWLYATARRVARNARVAADRRVRREGRSASPANDLPVDSATITRELTGAIDEELERLPAMYREPLVLCYLEGLTREDAAERLGVPAGTVKIRLERGRKRLGDALTTRGWAPGVGLVALAALTPVASATGKLTDTIVKSLGAPLKPSVAALVGTGATQATFKNVLGGLLIVAMVGALGFSPGGTAAKPAADKVKAEPAKAAETPKADDLIRTVSGTVVDTDGKAIEGASIIFFPIGGKPTVAATTGSDGKFKATASMKGAGGWLFPHKAGLASADYLMPALNTPAEKTFKMVKEQPIRGRIVDPEGKPVAGATVNVRSIAGSEDPSLDRYLKAWTTRTSSNPGPSPKGNVHWTGYSHNGENHGGDRKLPDGSLLFAAHTNKDGRFTITGVASERLVALDIEGPGVALTSAVIVCRDGFDPTEANRLTIERRRPDQDPDRGLGNNPILHGPTPNLVAEIEKPIRGTIIDSATGKPLAGLHVSVSAHWSLRVPVRMADRTATTDAAGRFEVRGVRKIGKYNLKVNRDVERGYVGRSVMVEDTIGYEAIDLKVPLGRGIVVTGRVMDMTEKKAVTGFVCAGVLFDSEYAKRPEYTETDTYDFAYTGDDGRFKTVLPPGPVLLMGGSNEAVDEKQIKYEMLRRDPDFPQYFTKELEGFRMPNGVMAMMQGQYCKVLNLKPDQKELTFDIPLKQPSKFRVKVRTEEGKPVEQVVAAGNTIRDWMYPLTTNGDTATVYEIERAMPRLTVYYDPKSKQFGSLTLKGTEKEPATVTLAAAGKIKGRLVNEAGEPLKDILVTIGYFDRAASEIDGAARGNSRPFMDDLIRTNANGEFEADGVVPGMRFTIYGRFKAKFLEPPSRKREDGFEVKPGEAKDLGNIKMKES